MARKPLPAQDLTLDSGHLFPWRLWLFLSSMHSSIWLASAGGADVCHIQAAHRHHFPPHRPVQQSLREPDGAARPAGPPLQV